jgi:hypothetical protein
MLILILEIFLAFFVEQEEDCPCASSKKHQNMLFAIFSNKTNFKFYVLNVLITLVRLQTESNFSLSNGFFSNQFY